MKMEAKALAAALDGFSGTNGYHRLSIGKLLFTDGCAFLAENAGAYWLMDMIDVLQPKAKKDPMLAEIQFWTLTIKDSHATLTCSRDAGDVAFTKRIGYTDFPLPSVRIWVENGVAMLPGER